jgi:hypothetical protein
MAELTVTQNLENHLGEAYLRCMGGQRRMAADAVKAALDADPELKAEAQARLKFLSDLITVRGRECCIVSATCFDVLSLALRETS